jgi:hypothetical protein
MFTYMLSPGRQLSTTIEIIPQGYHAALIWYRNAPERCSGAFLATLIGSSSVFVMNFQMRSGSCRSGIGAL